MKGDLKVKSGLADKIAPLIPPEIRQAIKDSLLAGTKTLETATAVRRDLKSGVYKGPVKAGDFAHLKFWTLADWVLMTKKVRSSLPAEDINRVVAPHLPVGSRRAINTMLVTEKVTKKVTRKMAEELAKIEERKAQIQAEAEARKAIDLSATADEELDSKKDLELLRRAIKSKLSIDEQAEILVNLARGDNAGVAKGALDQIRDIMGVKAANTPEAPSMGSIFMLPPDTQGPSVR